MGEDRMFLGRFFGSIRFCLEPVDRASPRVLRMIPSGESMFSINALSARSRAVELFIDAIYESDKNTR